MAKNKAYVVFEGREKGVFTSWAKVEELVLGFPGSVYKGFKTIDEAKEAFEAGKTAAPKMGIYREKDKNPDSKPSRPTLRSSESPNAETSKPAAPKLRVASPEGETPENNNPKPIIQNTSLIRAQKHKSFIKESWSVDAACSKNPGPMEYRGVDNQTGQEIFRMGPFRGTNNIGEFLAIVHALALQHKMGLSLPIYSDSVNALGWVKAKNPRTKLPNTANTKIVWELLTRATTWLQNNPYKSKLIKWETDNWGENPADFGRK